jgi:NitT/TauT family transport system substrate-binding protein
MRVPYRGGADRIQGGLNMASMDKNHAGLLALSRRGFLRAGLVGAAAGVASSTVLSWGDRPTQPLARAEGQSLQPVSFRLNFNPNAEHAPYYLGKKKGFYSAEGIDLNILPGTGSATAVKLVGSGDSMFGVAVADAVTVGRAQRVPVVSLGVLLQGSPTVLASLKSKNITKPTDLYGKKVGTNPQSTVYAFWRAFVKLNNLDASQMTEVAVTGQVVGPLLAGSVDAAGLLLTNEVVIIESRGQALNIMNYADFGVKSYGQTVFTSDKLLKESPDLAKRVARATFRSWTYTMAHVDEGIDALAEAVPETDRKLETAKWTNIRALASSPESQKNGFGYQTLDGWKQTYQTFKLGGLIESEFDPQSLFSNVAFGQ